VYDSTWEKVVADLCEKVPQVVAWAKNDHLDFVIRYLWRSSSRNAGGLDQDDQRARRFQAVVLRCDV